METIPAVLHVLLLCSVYLVSPAKADSNNFASCPGWYTEDSGTLSNPDETFPPAYDDYSYSDHCLWTFTVRPHQKLVLTVDFFFAHTLGCETVSLEIRDGAHAQAASLLLSSGCAEVIDKALTTTGNSIWIRLKKRPENYFPQFRATLRSFSDDEFLVYHEEPQSWRDAERICNLDNDVGGRHDLGQGHLLQFDGVPLREMDKMDNVDGWIGQFFTRWMYIAGCLTYSGAATPPAMTLADNSPLNCYFHCWTSTYFALRGQECFCWSTMKGFRAAAYSSCDIRCQGDQREVCGGRSAFNLYQIYADLPNQSERQHGDVNKYACAALYASGRINTYRSENCTNSLVTVCNVLLASGGISQIHSGTMPWEEAKRSCGEDTPNAVSFNWENAPKFVDVWTAFTRYRTWISSAEHIDFEPKVCFHINKMPGGFDITVRNCTDKRPFICQYIAVKESGMSTDRSLPDDGQSTTSSGPDTGHSTDKTVPDDGRSSRVNETIAVVLESPVNGGIIAVALVASVLIVVAVVAVAVCLRKRRRSTNRRQSNSRTPEMRHMNNITYGVGPFTNLAEEPTVLQQSALSQSSPASSSVVYVNTRSRPSSRPTFVDDTEAEYDVPKIGDVEGYMDMGGACGGDSPEADAMYIVPTFERYANPSEYISKDTDSGTHEYECDGLSNETKDSHKYQNVEYSKKKQKPERHENHYYSTPK